MALSSRSLTCFSKKYISFKRKDTEVTVSYHMCAKVSVKCPCWRIQWGKVLILAWVIIYIQTLCMYAVKALVPKSHVLAHRFSTLKGPIQLQQTKILPIFPIFEKIRYDISWEWSASRRFSWNIMPYLLFLKKQQNSKLSSAANDRWRFKG